MSLPTEIVIAAKNPSQDELKSEFVDFLYHAMVLMVERNVTWEELTEEMAKLVLCQDLVQVKMRFSSS